MQIPQSFFFRAIKPGRYLGGEMGTVCPAEGGEHRTVAWFYPGRYEDALGDAAYRRGYFALNALERIECVRAIEYATDLWPLLAERGVPPFALDGHQDLTQANELIFCVPSASAAAHIPSIVKRLRALGVESRIGAVINGAWAPNFLRANVDWVITAPHGWLPSAVADVARGGAIPAGPGVYTKQADNWGDLMVAPPAEGAILSHTGDKTPQWVPLVEAGLGLADLELFGQNAESHLEARPVGTLVSDALQALRETGLEGLRLCDSGIATGAVIPTTLIELTRVFNMARMQIAVPPVPVDVFDRNWRAYKPHLTKPVLPLRAAPGDQEETLIALGRDALNAGWHGLTLVLTFASYAEFSALVASAERITDGWLKAASGFDDRRPIRVEYDPAPIERWQDAPSEPSEVDFRRLSHECRHFRESVSNQVAVPGPHIEDIIARNWLAAAGPELWPSLAELDLCDQNDDSQAPHLWLPWIRQKSGMAGPPTEPFARCAVPSIAQAHSEEQVSVTPTPVAVDTSPSHMYGRRKKRPVFSRRLQAPSFSRMRVQWGKTVDWRLYSHLDMVRAIERAIRKSGIPVQYSEGFHPRMKISFGPPLSFGLTSRAELLDILLERGVEESDIASLQEAFPQGIFVAEAAGFPTQVPSLTETINEAEYSTLLPLPASIIQDSIQNFLSQSEIRWVRPDRPDRKPVDPRSTLRAMEMEVTPEGIRWNLCVTVGGPGGARPGDWAALVFGLNDDQLAELVIERTALRVRQNETVRSPLETVPV